MKSILVHLDASPRSAERLALACRLAVEHRAALTALYAVLPALVAYPMMAGDAVAAAYAAIDEVDREQRARARSLFERITGEVLQGAAGPATWAEIGTEVFEAAVQQQALLADLLVLGQGIPRDPEAGPVPADLPATLIRDSGKPALIVPSVGHYSEPAAAVLLAWKPTREAARAATAALPWMCRARRIEVACEPQVGRAERVGVAALERWLRLNGVTAPVTAHALPEDDIGNALLSLAADSDAQLLVMGCYGHSRAREWVLGGATRTVLSSMTLPVLMAH